MSKPSPSPLSKISSPSGPLTLQEVQAAFASLAEQYPPILSLTQAARLAHYTPGSLKKLVSQDRFPASAIRGRPLRFWRDRFVLEIAHATPPRRSAKPFREAPRAAGTGHTEAPER